MWKLEDVSQDIRNLTYRKQPNEAAPLIQSLQENELLDEDFVTSVMRENLSYNTIASSETHCKFEVFHMLITYPLFTKGAIDCDRYEGEIPFHPPLSS